MLTDMIHRSVELEIRGFDRAGRRIGFDDAHDTDDSPRYGTNGQLVREKPIRQTLLIEERLDDFAFGLTAGEDVLIIGAIVPGELFGKEIEVGFTNQFRFGLEPEAPPETTIGGNELEVLVLRKKRHARQFVEQLSKVTAARYVS